MNRAFFLRAGLVLAFAALLGAAFAGAASAQNLSRAQMQTVRAACEADIRATCPGVQPGGGRILQCMKATPDKISHPRQDLPALQGRAGRRQGRTRPVTDPARPPPRMPLP